MTQAMYTLNISTPALMKASLPISTDVAQYLSNRLVNQDIKRDQLLHSIGYPMGVGSPKGSFLDSVYNFANAMLKESKADQFFVQIEAIPAHPKFNPIFRNADQLPKHASDLIIIFKNKSINDGTYDGNRNKWIGGFGEFKEDQIHQWAYQDEFYASLNLPEFEEIKKNEADIPKEILKALLISALLSSKSTKGFPFNR